MTEPRWLNRQISDVIHHELMVEHGGTTGTRGDADALIESALARPKDRFAYEPNASLPALAAALMFGLATNHGFIDGNKRVAFAAAATFLLLNNLQLTATEVAAYDAAVGVADGRYSEEWLIGWFEDNTADR